MSEERPDHASTEPHPPFSMADYITIWYWVISDSIMGHTDWLVHLSMSSQMLVTFEIESLYIHYSSLDIQDTKQHVQDILDFNVMFSI